MAKNKELDISVKALENKEAFNHEGITDTDKAFEKFGISKNNLMYAPILMFYDLLMSKDEDKTERDLNLDVFKLFPDLTVRKAYIAYTFFHFKDYERICFQSSNPMRMLAEKGLEMETMKLLQVLVATSRGTVEKTSDEIRNFDYKTVLGKED